MRSWCGWSPARAVGIAVGLALLAAACTGGDPGEDPSPSASTPTSTPSTSYQKGEHRPGTLTSLCRGISERTMRLFGMKAPKISHFDASNECQWTEESGITRELSVRYQAFEPPETRREFTASDEAEYRFRRLDEWPAGQTSPVRGLADEAKLVRRLDPTDREGAVWLAVRQRNVVLDVRVEAQSFEAVKNHKMPTYRAFERIALSAVRDLLGDLTGTPAPSPTPTGTAGRGEVAKVRDVCGAARSAGRLVPGVPKSDTSDRDSARSGGCAWSGGEYQPELTVEVDALPRSTLDGASGTQVATQLHHGIYGTDLGRRAPGDDAKIDTFSFKSGKQRTVDVYVRKGNLLVSVHYGRWQHPSKKQLRRDALDVAADVLGEYR